MLSHIFVTYFSLKLSAYFAEYVKANFGNNVDGDMMDVLFTNMWTKVQPTVHVFQTK